MNAFTLDNTQGYTSKELKAHNKAFNEFLVSHGIDFELNDSDIDSCSWRYTKVNAIKEQYFNEFMC